MERPTVRDTSLLMAALQPNSNDLSLSRDAMPQVEVCCTVTRAIPKWLVLMRPTPCAAAAKQQALASAVVSSVTLPIGSLNGRLVLLVGEVNLLLGRLCLLLRCCRRWRRRRRLGLHGLCHLLLGFFHGLRPQKNPVRSTFQCCSFAMQDPQVFSEFMLPNRGNGHYRAWAVVAGADRSSGACM